MLNLICPATHPLPIVPQSLDDMPDERSADRCDVNTINVLFIDEQPRRVSEQLSRAFPAPQYQVQVAIAGPGAQLRPIRADAYDVVILCLGACTRSELEIYHQLRQIDACVPVIFVASPGLAEVAIEAIKQGAYDFLFHPIEPAALRRVVTDALAVARGRGTASAQSTPTATDLETEADFVGHCPAMTEVYKSIGRVADQNMMVLITGESGTGKELVARSIHQHSRRSDKPFLAINCAAIPEDLLESELFGHEKGAFTGADRRRIGKFEQCDGGTIFLDEIGDMPSSLQGKMLRVLQDQTFERVGGNETIRTDVRLIAATHRDLKVMSDESKFRADLYYRLSVFAIPLPPLRERGEDLPVLVRHYVRRFSRELNRQVQEVSPEAMDRLRSYPWPGNIRELQSVIKQSLLRATGNVLLPAFLPELSSAQGNEPSATFPEGWSSLNDFIRQRLKTGSTDLGGEAQLEFDRILLPAVLQFTNNSQCQASKILGVARQTLRQRLRNIGFSVVKTFGEGD